MWPGGGCSGAVDEDRLSSDSGRKRATVTHHDDAAKAARPDDDWDAHWNTLGDVAHETNPASRYRERVIIERLGPVPPGSAVLDIGCGQGEFLMVVKRLHPDCSVVGVDVSSAGIEHARRLASEAGVDAAFLVRDLLQPVDAARASAEVVTVERAVCSEVLEHVDDPATLLRNAARFLTSGSKLVVTVPGGPRTAFDRYIGHRRHFTRRRLTAVLRAAGYVPRQVDAIGFPVFNLYKLSVLLRGKRVIADASRVESPDRLSRLVLRGFDVAFSHVPDLRRGGWQIVAVAEWP